MEVDIPVREETRMWLINADFSAIPLTRYLVDVEMTPPERTYSDIKASYTVKAEKPKPLFSTKLF